MNGTLERTLAICAFVTSLVAVSATIYDGWQNRRYQRLTQIPFVHLDHSITVEGGFRIDMANSGNGPAIIKSISLFLDNSEIPSWDEFVAVAGADTHYRFTVPWPGTVIKPGVIGSSLLAIPDLEKSKAMWDARLRLNVRLCYCSLYDECMTIFLMSLQKIPTSSCPSESKIRLPRMI